MPLQTVVTGIPTDIPVRALVDAFKKMQPGEVMTYKVVAEITKIDPQQDRNRFRTVLHRARKVFFRDTRVALMTLRGEGVRYSTGSDQLRMAKDIYDSGRRRNRQAVVTVSSIDDERLSDVDQQKRNQLSMHALAIERAYNDGGKALSNVFKVPMSLSVSETASKK